MISIPSSSRFIATAFIVALIAGFGLSARAEDSKTAHQTHYVDDWTHHHLLFSDPGTRDDAVRHGRLDRWQKVNDNPRYKMQRGKREHNSRPVAGRDDHPQGWDRDRDGDRDRDRDGDRDRDHGRDGDHGRNSKAGIEKDWNTPLGTGAAGSVTVGVSNGSGKITGGTSTLLIDGVTFTAVAPTAEKATIKVNNQPATNDTVVVGGITYTYSQSKINSQPTSGCVINANACFSDSQYASWLQTAISSSTAKGSNQYCIILNTGPSYWCAANATANPAVTSSVNSTTITLTAAAPGATGFTLTSSAQVNTTTAVTTAGADGAADSTHFPYWAGATYISDTLLAGNIATAVNTNTTTNAVISATGGTNQITFANHRAGPLAAAPTSFSGFNSGNSASIPAGTPARVLPNAFPAKYGASLTTASCTGDFVVYPTGQPGSGATANIIAYNNLYAGGCATGNVPSVYWAYNTASSGDSVTTSPILSPYGDQLAFIESNGTYASLVLLKWKQNAADSITAPETLTTQSSGAAYRSCSGPCMLSIQLSPAASSDDTYSSPYYDWNSDTLYVGDDNGALHQFTGVFFGTPAETAAENWPKTVSAGVALSSPIFDAVSGYIFIGNMSGGFYSLTTAGVIHGTFTGGADAFADAPIVDGTQGTVYAVANMGAGGYFPGTNVLFQFTTGFTTVPAGSKALTLSSANGLAGHYLYSGAFDNLYYQTPFTGGNYYIVGNTAGTIQAQLFKVPITSSNTLGTVTAVASSLTPAVGVYPWPSPITEFCNGTCTVSGGATTAGTDYIFFSLNQGSVGGCTSTASHGCVLSYDVSNPASVNIATATNDGLTVTTPATPGCWATGGIVIDNDASVAAGASQIYFVNLTGAAAGGPNGAVASACDAGVTPTITAVQATQAAP